MYDCLMGEGEFLFDRIVVIRIASSLSKTQLGRNTVIHKEMNLNLVRYFLFTIHYPAFPLVPKHSGLNLTRLLRQRQQELKVRT